jgi:DNA-binding PadR family transcriptional regulator
VTAPRSTTTYAVLGLLALRDWTTYELAKQMQRSLHWFWPRAERKLYEEPKRLVADGLATASAEATGKRPRTVYSITPAGRSALADWLDEPSASRSTEFEALVKVFFADAGSADQLRTTLDRILADTGERLADLADVVESGITSPQFPERAPLQALCLKGLFEQELSTLQWARWARAEVDGWTSVDAAGAEGHRAMMAGLVAQARAAVG